MTQTQTRYKLVSPTDNTRVVDFVVEGDDVWIHYYGGVRPYTITHPVDGRPITVQTGSNVSRELGKAVWDRFVEVGFVRG